jgi:mannose-6-phosphate isomerase-like protein (cupin superfamily)
VIHELTQSRSVSAQLKITPGESLVIRHSEPDLLEVEATYAPRGRRPPKHYHPDQDERFEVVAGRLRTRVADRLRDLGPGGTLEIPRCTEHQMWNPGEEPARVIWQTRPRLRTEEWFRRIDHQHRTGRVGRNGMPGPLAFAVLDEYGDVFRLGVPAQPVVRGALALLAGIGRARGAAPAPD